MRITDYPNVHSYANLQLFNLVLNFIKKQEFLEFILQSIYSTSLLQEIMVLCRI